MTNRPRLTLLVPLVFVVFSGCSGGGPPPLDVFPVTGSVRLDGEPIGGVSVTFIPESGVAGGVGSAVSDDAGQFSMKSGENLDGVPAGEYRVLFMKMTLPDGSPIPEGAMAADVGAENRLPRIYNDLENTSIKAVVEAGENAPFEFELRSTR